VLLAASGSAQHSPQTLRELEAKAASNANDPQAILELAFGYALALLGPDPDGAKYARTALDQSANVWVLGNAAYRLQCEYNEWFQRGRRHALAARLAERYFLQAKRLDPKLDREKILPKLDEQKLAQHRDHIAQEQREWAQRFEQAAKEIKRLQPEAFPNLPATLASFLRTRGCTVPQPAGANSPRNVIKGEFLRPGQQAWAVLCSADGWSTILVFRTPEDRSPHRLAKLEDRTFLQGLDKEKAGYSREIGSAGRAFILSHAHNAVGQESPPITHPGINDAFLEKASVVHYFHQGRWLKLPGAD
jgi:hypothetical protein